MKSVADILVKRGLVPQSAVAALIAEAAKKKDLTFEELVVSKKLAAAEDVYKALAEEMGYPFIETIDGNDLDGEIVALAPMAFCREHKLLPLHRQGDLVVVVTARPFDFASLDDLKFYLRQEIAPAVATPTTIVRAIELWYASQKDMTQKVIASLDDERERYATEQKATAEDLLDMSQAPVVQLVNSFLYEAIKARASDIHIEPYEDKIKVRYRIDGVLFDAPTPPKELQSLIISRIKIQSQMDIAESRLPQDGSMSIVIGDQRLDIRVSTLPTKFGERIVMRILEKSHSVLKLSELGFCSDAQKIFEKLIVSPHGIFLVTGPTGSGKSTTLYSSLLTINSSETSIITLEDPIENEIKDIGQVQVKPEIGLSFGAGLRHILRQDPDVIMVGEIRDLETAEISVQAALTGHLVFSTLHTNDSASTITRLADMGIEPYLISSTVIGILAQRLVRVLCPQCRVQLNLTEKERDELHLPSGVIFQEKGCPACRDTGYQGRIGIFELMPVDGEMSEAISGGRNSQELKNLAVARGMRTLRQDALIKVSRGVTSLHEVNRVTGLV